MGRTYCIPQCKSGKGVLYHKFPKDPIRCDQWIKNLNLHQLKTLCANELQKFNVCHEHFREEDYSNTLHHRFLLNTAIPFLNINDNIEVDTVGAINNVQQQSFQVLENNESQQNIVSQSMNMLHLHKQVQQHSRATTIIKIM